MGVHPFAERVRVPGLRELVRVGTGVAVEGSSVRVIPGNVGVEGRGGSLPAGGSAGFHAGLRW